MADVVKLGNAEFRTQVEAATKGLAEASDGLMGVLKTAKAQETALLADAMKLGVQYDVHQEMIALQQALKVTAEGGVDLERAKTVLEALAQKAMQDGHPLQGRIKALAPDIKQAVQAKDHTAIGKIIQTLVGENGLPKGPIRDMIAQLQKPLEQVAEHGAKIVQLAESEGTLSAAKEQILKEVAANHLPKVREHMTSLEGLGMAVPKEAHEQLGALERKLVHSVADHEVPHSIGDAVAEAMRPDPGVTETAAHAIEGVAAQAAPEARIVEEAVTHARPFGEIVSEMSRRTKKAYGSAQMIEAEAYELEHKVARAVIPFDEIAKLPAATKLAIETRINENFFRNPVLTMLEACKATKDAGIPIDANRVQKLEALMANDMMVYIQDAGAEYPMLKGAVFRNMYDDNKEILKALGANPRRILGMADNPEILAAEMSKISPDAVKWKSRINIIAAQDKAATMAAEAAEAEAFAKMRARQAQPVAPSPTPDPAHTPASSTPHSSGGSSYSSSSTPSTTVTGEGRKWYQWLTHELEGEKAVFSGKRTSIAAGAAAAVAGGVYLLKRNKEDDSWQGRTSRPAESAPEATR